MIEGSTYLGAANPDQMKSRVGKSEPRTGISLFTGIGGFDIGMERAGFDVRVMVEEDEDACDILNLNMPDFFCEHTRPEILQEDIQSLSTKDILDAAGLRVGEPSIVFGGPPCQGFSHGNPNRSEDDPRNSLVDEMVRVVREAKPYTFMMENVPGLASMSDGEVIRRVCQDYADAGYNVRWKILDAADFGVPQHRERVIMIGSRVDVAAFTAAGPQYHMAARPGKVTHPESFREKHGLAGPEQSSLDGFASEPETVTELLDQVIENGGVQKSGA